MYVLLMIDGNIISCMQSLVPMGESFAEPAGSSHATIAPLGFGQGITTSVGANRSLQQVITYNYAELTA